MKHWSSQMIDQLLVELTDIWVVSFGKAFFVYITFSCCAANCLKYILLLVFAFPENWEEVRFKSLWCCYTHNCNQGFKFFCFGYERYQFLLRRWKKRSMKDHVCSCQLPLWKWQSFFRRMKSSLRHRLINGFQTLYRSFKLCKTLT